MTATPDAAPELLDLLAAIGGIAAPCQAGDAELWFALDPGPAVKLCAGCHAQPECADLARANGERFGVWAGVDLARKRTKRAVAA